MKRSYFLFVILFAFVMQLEAQLDPAQVLKLKNELANAKEDSTKIRLLSTIAIATRFSDIDTSLVYMDLATKFARRTGNEVIEVRMINLKGASYLEAGRLPEALEARFALLRFGEDRHDSLALSRAYNGIGNIYMELGDYSRANDYYFLSANFTNNIDRSNYYNELSNIGNIHTFLGNSDSALFYLHKVAAVFNQPDLSLFIVRPELMYRLGNAYKLKGDSGNALIYYHKAVEEALDKNDIRNLSMANLLLAKYFLEKGRVDSSRYYAYSSISSGRQVAFKKGIAEAALVLNELFRNEKKYDSAYKYLQMSGEERESLFGKARLQELQKIVLKETEQRQKADKERFANESRQKQMALLAGLAVFLVIATILLVNNRQKKKANKVLESTLKDLRAAQTQLVQSEKMASLGELTAGIAHEIQNPLNFVNNFSELNTELIEELRQAAEKGDLDEVRSIVSAIQENESKINQHGKRADSIVKSMLQHSRKGSGIKEPADINLLADEFVRLAYHGLRAREKNFNATIETSYDKELGKVNIVSQDIGRVLLNIINNAFYAMAEKRNKDPLYSPILRISTEKKYSWAEIHISDNGPGIPTQALDKIFQPFFTTKPTGEGTGLGLSLSYDIVTKGHGGELKVETEEGKGSMFIIRLPLK